MLKDPPARERQEAAAGMRAGVARILRDLQKLSDAVRKARAAVPAPQDPVSLDRLLESRDRAIGHARRAAAALGADRDKDGSEDGAARALPDVHELVEEVRAGVMSPRILDDLAEMGAEADDRPGGRFLRALDTLARRVGAEADRLFSLALAAQQLSAGAKPMPDPSASKRVQSLGDGTADAVRELSDVLAATLAGPPAAAPPPARSAGGRFSAVADQIAASLNAYGMPHEGAQLPRIAGSDAVRSQLIAGLRRNFASREEDGTRTYFRSAPQPVAADADLDMRLLRGSALVNANLLRAEADGVLAIVDRLPDMLRFVPARPQGAADARTRLRGMLDRLVETASDPLGANARRGAYQFKRLSAALIDVLRSGEVIGPDTFTKASGGRDDGLDVWRLLARGEGPITDDLRSRTSAVRDEEVLAELGELGRLMEDIHERVTKTPDGAARGVAAARLEELLLAADTAAAALEAELHRFGTAPAEQDVQPLGADGDEISLGQLIAWVRALCAPFAGAEHAAAGLFREDLRILKEELDEIGRHAEAFGGLPPSVRFGGARRQLDELKQLLAAAAAQAGKLAA